MRGVLYMNNIWTIIKKEMKRVFSDYRVILSLFVLPPVTIFLIYGLMGLSAQKESNKMEEYIPNVLIINAPNDQNASDDFESFLNSIPGFKGEVIYKINVSDDELVNYQEQVKNKEVDLILVFPDDFKTKVEQYESGVAIPRIEAHYNINYSYSTTTYSNFMVYLNEYEKVLVGNRIDLDYLDVFETNKVEIGDKAKEKGSVLGMILPLLVVIYLMAGAMSVGIESIAGEKERGTIATLLITPIKRSELAIGKIISISILGLLSSLASFLGIVATLPQFAKMSGEQANPGEALGLIGGYSIADIAMLLSTMVVAVLLFVALVVIVSTYAKSVKEASALIMPLYMVVMGAAMFTMFNQEVSTNFTTYLIPVYSIIIALKAILSFDMTFTNFWLTLLSTLFYTFVFIFIIQKMFKSEKVMFKK
jgi:sodium transport system permease protein